ncbi:hypothetical protein BH10PLA2_BH10PLA2_19470 [soil metagenome]
MMDRKTDWKPGDVVALVSGGPLMTVVGKDNNNRSSLTSGQFICQWFDSSEKLCTGHFDPVCLREATPPQFSGKVGG